MTADLDSLNRSFCIPGEISFLTGLGGLTSAFINNRFGTALVTLAGAHVMSYRPHAGREVFWTSPTAEAELSEAMRGGVPVCWPWFANHPENPTNLPLHGLVRTQVFDVTETRSLSGGETILALSVKDTPSTLNLWPQSYRLLVTITLGQSLKIEWSASNPGSEPYRYTGAFHPYFLVSNVHEVCLRGLEGTDYLDNYDGLIRKHQAGPVMFPTWADNIYLNTTAGMTIEDPGYQRLINIHKTGSHTTVVWNPAHDDANLPDVGAGQHTHFLCVESANAADDVVTILPGGEANLGIEIEVAPWRNA